MNLIAGYAMMVLLILLVLLNRATELPEEEVKLTIAAQNDTDETEKEVEGLFVDSHKDGVVYIDGHKTVLARDYSVGRDHGVGVVLDDEPDVVVVRDDIVDNIAVVSNPDHVVLHGHNSNKDIIIDAFENAPFPDKYDQHYIGVSSYDFLNIKNELRNSFRVLYLRYLLISDNYLA